MSLSSRAGSSFGYWSRTTTDDEYLPALKFPQGPKVYDRMRRSDPQVNAVIQAVFSPILSAKWIVEPAEEGNAQDEEIAKFVENNLMPAHRDLETGYSYSRPWKNTLRNILLFVPFGFMVIEKVYAAVDSRIVIEDLGPRLPKTITEFKYDKNGNDLLEIVQKVAGQKFNIPAEKSIIFTLNKEGSNAVGISLLRPIYKPWSIKEDLEKIQAIMFERYGVGTPYGEAPPNTKPGDEAFDSMETALENVASQESSYLIVPKDSNVGILGEGTSSAPDIKSALQYYDNQIAMAWHAMFMMLGQTTSGNRALGQTFMDFFLTTVQSIGDSIADTLNSDLIPELVQFNFNTERFPKIKMLEIQDIDFDVLAKLKTAGLITSTLETENRLRDLLGINVIEEDELENEEDENVEEPENEEDENVEEPEDDEDENVDAHEHHHTKNFARRDFTQDEINAGLPEAEKKLDEEHEKTVKKLLLVQKKQAKSIADQIGRGRRPNEINVPNRKEMYTELLDTYKSMVAFGKKQEERAAKKQGVSLADVPSTANELTALIEDMLSVEVEGAGSKLKSMMLTEAVRLKRLGITGNDLELALIKYVADEVSEVTWNDMAATAVNGGWGDGRNIVVNQLADMVDHQVYSAVLDDSTCDVCRAVDGDVHAPGDPDHVAPNPGCMGGDKCRCVNITFYKQEGAV